ncbi:MAG: glycerol-3-phosphate acyltransferase [Clostridiales bacterium]|jgi:glycerol-3-phosphate acyltransferase PlsY|nr:glycerol-3-phosphate acyltransferase [Clostridiales bacterium]
MLIWWRIPILVILSYLMGNISFAKTVATGRHVDITKHGSGNPGTMNIARTLGWKFGVFTLLLDAAKAVVPCLIGGYLLEYPDLTWPDLSSSGVLIAGISVIVGHMLPVFHRWKGGKGVASAIGVFLVLDWMFTLGGFALALLIFLLFRYGSVASLCCIIAMTAVEYTKWFAFGYDGLHIVLDVVLLGAIPALILIAHRENLKRLILGRERRVDELPFVKEVPTDDNGDGGG